MRDRDHDLPLFSWTPPACVVIPFPARHRVGKARRVAEVLSGKRGRDADTYWHRIIRTMLDQMERAGVPRAEAERQARDFFDAVQGELDRMAYATRSSGSGPSGSGPSAA